MASYSALLSPFKLKTLELRNRVVSTAHATVYTEGNMPKERYQAYHEEKAKGGIGLTIFGGSSNVARDSGSVYGNIYVGDDAVIPYFQQFAKRIHRHGTALMCQITHMGRRTTWKGSDWISTVGPSLVRDPAHHSMPRAATREDIERITQSFGDAAVRCQEGGLDGCEILASVHILGQFLSPLSNKREDEYGGDLTARMRFLMEVLTEVRSRVGDDFVVGLRYTADESNEGGMSREDGIEIGRRIGPSGLIDFINVNGAYGGTTKGLSETFPGMAFPSAPHLELAREVRNASGLPTMQAARITDPATANFAVEDGALDLVGMVRPHMADPHIVKKLMAGQEERIRPCVGAGYCLDRAYLGGDALCLHNVSTGRESLIPHEIAPADAKRKVVVVGGGPAGMEAARVARLRGHDVVLFEAAPKLGGQILLAAKAGWRKDMIGVADWLAAELDALGVDVRCNVYAEAEEITSENPDVVIVATGGLPTIDLPDGGDSLASSVWDVLSGDVDVSGTVLIHDEAAGHAAISLADLLATRGNEIVLSTTDRHTAREVGGMNAPSYLDTLYAAGARFVPDHAMTGVRREGNELIATMRNMFSRGTMEVCANHIVIDQGTMPNTDVAESLAPVSRNRGIMDFDRFADVEPQPDYDPEDGPFELYTIGDAVSGRDLHAALFDGNRLARTL